MLKHAILMTLAAGAMACGRTRLDDPHDARHDDLHDARAPEQGTAADARARADADSDNADGADDGASACRWSFAKAVAYPVKKWAQSVTAGDLDGDGFPDIVTPNGSDGSVGILSNRGDGSFAPQVTQAVGAPVSNVVLGDWNGDGSLDLAVVYDNGGANGDEALGLLFNRGDGSFGPDITFLTLVADGTLAPGDFDGDGNLDLAIVDARVAVSILHNLGQGVLIEPAPHGGGWGELNLVTGDFNRDGALDLAAAVATSFLVLLNRGDGTFAPPVFYSLSSACFQTGALAVADFTGDGYPDLAYACDQGSGLGVRVNNGDGTFGPETMYPVVQWPSGLAFGDFDGDGRLDLAAVSSWAYATSLVVLPGTGNAKFGAAISYAVTANAVPGYEAPSLVSADFNRDGHPDLAVANADVTVNVLLSQCR